jgi:hypothetical protein
VSAATLIPRSWRGRLASRCAASKAG